VAELVVVADFPRAWRHQCAGVVDAPVCGRVRPAVAAVAIDRNRSPLSTQESMARLGAVPPVSSGSQALRANVLREPMSKGRVLSEVWQFLRQEKKYWLLPIIVVFVLLGLLTIFAQSSAVAPFIYTLF
jgi:hypothetical protein